MLPLRPEDFDELSKSVTYATDDAMNSAAITGCDVMIFCCTAKIHILKFLQRNLIRLANFFERIF